MTTKSTKSSLELRRRIRKAETEKREKLIEANPVTIITEGDFDNKITFNQWWMLINKKVKIKPWMKEIILVDFKARGLTQSESENKYDQALKVFGLKW